MARLRYRWLLPLGHALADVIVLSHTLWIAYPVPQGERYPCGAPHGPLTLPWLQPPPGVEWSWVSWWTYQPLDFKLMALGTPPASLISFAVRPGASELLCDRLWDPVWFSIHETIALLFWFLVGRWLDPPGTRFRKLLSVYLGLRLALSPLCWLSGLPSVGLAVEFLFWPVFSVCALVYGCRWLLRRLHQRP